MTQPTIKLLLIAAIAVIGWYALRGGKRNLHGVVWRAFVLLILCAGVLSILFPGGLSWTANRVGVGRGADVRQYVHVVTLWLVSVILLRRRKGLEPKYVTMAGVMAIQEASTAQSAPPTSRNNDNGDSDD